MFMRSFVAATIVVASWACLSGSVSAQIRPRFMILFDTSGSMAVDLDGIPTFGDGITGGTRGLDTDCDGLANDSRIFVAKEALRNMVLAFGDIEFGLTSFPRFAASQVACTHDRGGAGPFAITHRIQNNECNLATGPFVGGIGDPTANTGTALNLGNCGSQWDGVGGNEIPTDLIPAACRPGTGGRPAARLWAAGSPQFCTNYLGGCPGVNNGVYTYPNGDVLVGFSGFGWPTTVDNRVGMLKWIDQRETSFSASTTSGNFCNHSGTGDCELRPQGPTPLAGTLRAARDYMIPIRTADSVGTCRPYTVLLLTDGVETCDSMTAPVTTAAELRAAGIPVYVVGLAIDPGGRTLLNQIATAGGTDAGGAGGDTAFFADDEVTLAAGLADIVADSLLVELCNGVDDNCNGLIDEGFVKYCNRPAGVTGLTLCADPGETVCNGIDDNCDGRIDEGLLNACGSCGPVPVEVCNGLDDDCDGVIDDGGVCDTCRPEAEICDDRDNDCDGRIDETLSRACGVDVGECSAGTQTCTRGAWGACSDVGPSPEICNGLDDDCDGLPDNLTEACGSDTGACSPGIRRCVAGAFGTCEGAIGPTAETCNTIDDDCDGRIDEMVPGVGVACGTDEGVCMPGATACVGGAIVCTGGTGPTEEICNGLDDDCDGLIDDGIFVGTPCGTDVGECSPGFNRCVDGMVRCEDAIGPMGESCNGLDDDCDGDVDEGLGLGEACGSDEGVCMPGSLQCVDGEETCVGEVPGGPEACDCEDDDCDGAIDEVPPGGSLCPTGSACVECQCALPCIDSEFGPSCPTGRAPREIDGTCYCVREACNAATCATETIERDGDTLCAPDSDDVSTCVCRDNECTFACEGVVCGAGTVCDPRDPAGRCVEDSCRGLGCAAGELCNVVSGECEPDPCESLSCGDEACRAGVCEPSCADVTCPSGQRCASGVCEADMCADKPCPGQVCDPATGACVDDECGDVRCPTGAICDPVSGDCRLDPCRTLRCPSGQLCIDGECARGDEPMRPDAGTTPDRTRVLAAGGGGCSCDAAGAPSGVGGSGWLVVLGLGVWMFARRMQRAASRSGAREASRATSRKASRASRRRVALTIVASALFFGGCDVEPFCFDCQDAIDAGPVDAGLDGGRRDAMLPDVGTPDAGDAGCLAAEECNDRDDDCDGNVDEGIDTTSDPRNCGECGDVCSPPGAFPVCNAGVCELGGCDVGFVDLNGDPDDGCEYRCLQRAEDDVICDLRDDDCDGLVDEDVDTSSDVLNCGACGRACRFSRATPTCNAGTCEIASCNEGFYDLDGVAGNGCEYGCLIADPPTERCNARDDDCDGRTDEGNPDSGAACGETAGECAAGAQQCMGGSLVCVGAVGPRVETCNTRDDDCDGRTDETTNLLSDPNNCGGCGVVCSQPNAVTRCSGGVCSRVSCRSGFVDLDGMASNGCEYACDARGTEVCNGADDDCDGRTDEGLTPPANFCNANGICAGTTPTCGGAMGWRCTYTNAAYQEVESRCDGVDNDCDGMVDEPFPTRGNACSNGRGLCQRNGMLRCTADGTGLECSAPAPGTPTAETCDGRDEDCDGRTDEGLMPGAGGVSTVRFTRPGATVHVMSYEASRPDATMSAAGSSNTAACSRASRIPWTTVTWDQAQAACCALNAGGTCPAVGADGWRLCDGDDWQRACEGPAGTCDWSYASNCTTSQPTVCNGSEVAGTDAIAATGAFASCNTPWTGVGNVYDLSGNVKEWTSTQVATDVYAIRGGAYNNLEAGRTCEFDFTVGSRDFAFPNTGFRCCFYDF